MNTAEVYQVEIELDEGEFLVNMADWNEGVALIIASQRGITKLGVEHWQVIHALRKYYDKFGVAPAMHNICHANGKEDNWVHNLFQTCLNAWYIAGLPDPGEEAKSYLSDM